MSKLQTYKYIDDQKLKNKFEVTNLLETSNVLDSYYKDTLKDFSPESPGFAYEEPRKNHDSVGKLNTHYYGRRNSTEPFQDDLFLGFTEKDPRSIHLGPLMGKYQDQIWHRKDDYKFSFKDDSDNSVPGVGEAKVLENKKLAYNGLKERYKNFEESKNNIYLSNDKRFNSKSIVDNTEIDIKVLDTNDKNIDKINNNTIINKTYVRALSSYSSRYLD